VYRLGSDAAGAQSGEPLCIDEGCPAHWRREIPAAIRFPMNTPRTKPLKRWRPPVERSGESHPQGVTWGITDRHIAAAYGYLVSYWWHVEEQMIYLLDELLTGQAKASYPPELSARQVFRSITSQDGRIKLMKNLLETLQHNVHRCRRYDELIDEFAAVNSLRNKFVHGIWATDSATGEVRLRKATIQHEAYEPSTVITLAEIEAVQARMRSLFERVAVRNQPNHPSYR